MDATHRKYNIDDPQAHYELSNLPDCVSLTHTGKCALLGLNKCRGTQCGFLSTESDIDEALSRWSERLSSLGEEEQLRIAKKYYNGKMPWNEKSSSHTE